jgi:hypothetical protein
MFNYNAACVYGRALERATKDEQGADRDKLLESYKSAALSDLKKAIESGFQDFNLMKKDPDLKSLSDLPEFQKMLTPSAAPPAAPANAQRVKAAVGAAVRLR